MVLLLGYLCLVSNVASPFRKRWNMANHSWLAMFQLHTSALSISLSYWYRWVISSSLALFYHRVSTLTPSTCSKLYLCTIQPLLCIFLPGEYWWQMHFFEVSWHMLLHHVLVARCYPCFILVVCTYSWLTFEPTSSSLHLQSFNLSSIDRLNLYHIVLEHTSQCIFSIIIWDQFNNYYNERFLTLFAHVPFESSVANGVSLFKIDFHGGSL